MERTSLIFVISLALNSTLLLSFKEKLCLLIPSISAICAAVKPNSTIRAFNFFVSVILSPPFSHFGYTHTIHAFSHSVNSFFDIFSKKVDKTAILCYSLPGDKK